MQHGCFGVCDRTFRRQIDRYKTGRMDALLDKRLTQRSYKRAPIDEVMGLADLYRKECADWNVKHFHTWYAREHDGQRGYTWVKNQLQQAGVIIRAAARGKHRLRSVICLYFFGMQHSSMKECCTWY